MDWITASRVDLTTGAYVEALYIKQDAHGDYYDLLGKRVPTEEIVFAPLPVGIFTPIWDFDAQKWIDGLSDEEIAKIKNQPREPSLEERLASLEKKVKAIEEGENIEWVGGSI